MPLEEVEDFVAISDSLAVNIGTLSPPWVAAMRLAVARARALGKPWVLDPVGCGATPYRTQVAGRVGGAVAERHPRQCQRDHEPGRAGGRGRQGRRLRRARRGCDIRGCRVGQAGRLRGRRHRRYRLCKRRRRNRCYPCRRCADAAIDRARLFAQRRYRRLCRRPPAARSRDCSACRFRGSRAVAAKNCNGPGHLPAEICDALYRMDRATLASHARLSM